MSSRIKFSEQVGIEGYYDYCQDLWQGNTDIIQVLKVRCRQKFTSKSMLKFSQVNWQNLKLLFISYNSIGDKGCKYLSIANSTNLQLINIGHNQITSIGIFHLSKSILPKLQILGLFFNKIGPDAILALSRSNWPQLTDVNLDGNRLTYKSVIDFILFGQKVHLKSLMIGMQTQNDIQQYQIIEKVTGICKVNIGIKVQYYLSSILIIGNTFIKINPYLIKAYAHIYNQFLFFVMPFEYRIITEAIKALESYNQLDLYFFKPKLSSVGIKVRMSNRKSELWDCDDLQLKYIKNTKDIQNKLTILEDWKKIHMPVEFQIFTKQYMTNNAQKFGISVIKPIETAISHQLQKLNRKICEAIMNAEIKEKHFDKNPDLANWVNPQYPIAEIFAVQKSKLKSFTHEKGQFKVYPLYGSNIAPTVWDTFGFEAHSEKSLRKILTQSGQQIKENISYPKILERIYFK